MSRLLLIIIPLLLLVGMIALSRATEDWRYVVEAAPDEVMYAAGFDGFLDEWSLYDDGQLAAAVEDGVLRLSSNAPFASPYTVASPVLGDFDLRVKATAVEGPLNNGFGVMFHVQDRDNNDQFLISSDGYYRVVRFAGGEERELSTWIPSDVVRQGIGETNELRVVRKDNTLSFYVNGEPVELCLPNDPGALSTYTFSDGCFEGEMRTTLVDDSLRDGRIGVVIQTFDEPGVVVEFDDLVVVGPEA
ncbi:MAG: hypothetical protein DIU68_008855 [Chloroflexota bacterium]